MIVGTFIGICSGTGIVCSGVGVVSGVGINGGARGNACFRSFVMNSIALVVVYP